MNLTLRKSEDRGHANRGWLESRHTFSFADYHDPAHMGFRSLRVINEDRVSPGGGFPTHPHRDMEIFSYVITGTLAHKDSLGNGRNLTPGQIQLMSAGTGVQHSEFNPSATEALHFLQIWIKPQRQGIPPSYTEWHPSSSQPSHGKSLVISPDGRDQSAVIHQDADVYILQLAAGESTTHTLRPGRGMWVQVIRGTLVCDAVTLAAGDAVSTEDSGSFTFSALDEIEALLFDLA